MFERTKALDQIFLRHFFDDCIPFFTQRKPPTEDIYREGYAMVYGVWVAIRDEIDTYPLPDHLKRDLYKLFSLADDFFVEVISEDNNYSKPVMHQRWEEMRLLANRIYQSGKQAGF